MKSKVTIAIVGATSTGCATACALAATGWPDILVMDRQKLPGTVSYPDIDPGFVFAPAIANADLPLLQESTLVCRDLSFRAERAFDPVGSLTLASTEAGMTALSARAAELTGAGIGAFMLTPTETAMRLPILDPARVAGSLWVPSDGIVHPHVVRAGLIDQAREQRLRFSDPTRPDPAADAQITFRGGVSVDAVERGTQGWRLDSNRGAIDAHFAIWAADHAPDSLQRPDRPGRTGAMSQSMAQTLYVETAPLSGLKWLSDAEVTLPAVHHWESGLSLRQRHGCLGVLGAASGDYGLANRNGRRQAEVLIATIADMVPELSRATVSTTSIVPALQQTHHEGAVADLIDQIGTTGFACPPVPSGLAVGLGRRIARDLAGDNRHQVDHARSFDILSARPRSRHCQPVLSAGGSPWTESGSEPSWTGDADAIARDAQTGITLH